MQFSIKVSNYVSLFCLLMKVDFGDFKFMRIQPRFIRYASGIVTPFNRTGGLIFFFDSLCKAEHDIQRACAFVCFDV